MASNSSLELSTGNKLEMPEQIEWDLPYEVEGSGDFPDLSNLSIGTEMRNKMWESDNKIMLGEMHGSGCSSPSPSLDINQNLTQEQTNKLQYMNGMHLKLSSLSKVNSQPNVSLTGSESYNVVNNAKFVKGNGSQLPAGTGISSSNVKQRPRSQPLLQSPIHMPNDHNPSDLMQQEGSYPLDARRVNETQTLKEELLEMKSIFTRLASKTDDVSGLPEPVQLALKIIELEGCVQENEQQIQNQERNISSLHNQIEKSKQAFEFVIASLKKENEFLKEKLEYKATLEASTKGLLKSKEEKKTLENVEVEKLKEEIKKLKEDFETKEQEAKMKQDELEQKVKMAEYDASNFEKDVNILTEQVNQDQAKEQKRKSDIEKYIMSAREAMERERKDRYILLVEQNKLKHKVEKLSENCKSYQLKNEELCRIQNELEQECDQFRKVKKIIQEHGLPNHEHLAMLQQQTEMFKDDVLSERKDRERAQAQRDKLRRDLEILQSRNQSLQEQVYKYQEHIMRLNTGDRRIQQDFIPQHQGNGNRFSRQISNSAYFNPRIRMATANVVNPLIKNPIVSPGVNPGSSNRHSPPVGVGDASRMVNGFPKNMNGRGGGNIRSPQSFGNNGGFDPWQQQRTFQHQGVQQQPPTPPPQQQPQQMPQRNSYPPPGGGNRVPQSPLLGPNGDPWVLPPSSPSAINPPVGQFVDVGQKMQMGGNYGNNIWSQQTAPVSPNSFASSSSMRVSQAPSSPSWQVADGGNFAPTLSSSSANFVPASSSPHEMNNASNNHVLNAVPGGINWSTVVEENTNTEDPTGNQGSALGSDGVPNDHGNQFSNYNSESAAFQCRKCNAKLADTDSFRVHAELCFN